MKQRIIIVISTALGATIWLGAASALKASDGGAGLSITTAQSGLLTCLLAIIGFGLPVMAMGLFTSAAGHPLSGVFVIGAALAIVAGMGGSIDDWLRLQAQSDALPGAYRALAGEVILWQVVVLLAIVLIYRWRTPLRRRLPDLAKSPTAVMGESIAEEIEHDEHPDPPATGLIKQLIDQLGPMCITAAAAGLLGYLLIRSSDTGQVIWSLIVAFAVASLIGQLIFRSHNPVGALCSPALLALVAYGLVLMKFNSTDDLLQGWYKLNSGMSAPAGLALALPIHYIAAGVVGCTLGLGISQAFMNDELVMDDF